MNIYPFSKTVHRVMRRSLLALALCALLVNGLWRAQAWEAEPRASYDESSDAALYQSLLDLTNAWTVMCVAAHPDDEDGATLTVLRRKYGAHTVSLFSTYGEGGQNAVGPELYEELGAIRARETVAAAQIQGSEPSFLGLPDFGFSKSADEAFRIWGHDEALRRMVLKIRELRPDVIITNHDTVSGHGHHQATGRLVLEAFDAAADPARFPEQLRDGRLSAWQPQRLFVRFSFEGGAESKAAESEATRAGAVVSIDPNERDTVRGSTYAEQALKALQQHATQGPWPQSLPPGGRPVIRYRLAKAAKGVAPLPANAQTFLDGLSLPQAIAERVMPLAAKALLSVYLANKGNRQSTLAALVAARKAGLFELASKADDTPRFALMTKRLDHALAVASGLKLNIKPTSNSVLIPGTPSTFWLTLSNDGAGPVELQRMIFREGSKTISTEEKGGPMTPGHPLVFTEEYVVAPTATVNVPHSAHLYDGLLFGRELDGQAIVNVDGAVFTVTTRTQIDVAPPVEIASITPSPLVLTPQSVKNPATFTLGVVNHMGKPVNGFVAYDARDGVRPFGTVASLIPNQTNRVTGKTRVMFDAKETASSGGSDYKFLIFPSRSYASSKPYTQASVKVLYSDARVAPKLRVGYVRSYDDTIANALAALGVASKELTIDEIRTGDLRGYQTIIIDNRGYQAHPELVAANSRLLEYARQGGTLIVFYHKTNEWNPDPQKNRPQLAPYPIILGGSRITDENAPVTFTEPQSPLLNFPNKIGPEDFQGWIQERGLYYPQEWDAHYSAPLASSDAGEQPLRGGLLAAQYGQGRYIYTSMVWYRQLRAGVPGAYRIFANMISFGSAGQRTLRATTEE
jgi:LmbE family N-acetylglucosaminyl deacetylase